MAWGRFHNAAEAYGNIAISLSDQRTPLALWEILGTAEGAAFVEEELEMFCRSN
jgi:hypothetical protein